MIMWVDSIMAELEEIVESCGCTLYDVSVLRENEAQILRISVIKDGGVSLDDCELVSQSISPFLDVKDVIKDAYTLEVSSPGIERVLKNPRHFMLSCGEMVQIRLLDKQEIVGVLVKADEQGVWVDVEKVDSRGNVPSPSLRAAWCAWQSTKTQDASEGSSLESSLEHNTQNKQRTAFFEKVDSRGDTKPSGFIPYTAIKRAKTIFEW